MRPAWNLGAGHRTLAIAGLIASRAAAVQPGRTNVKEELTRGE